MSTVNHLDPPAAQSPDAVVFDVQRPERFQREHVLLRALIALVFAFAASLLWLLTLIYLVVPIVTALMISSKGSERFVKEDVPRLTRWLAFFVAADSYLTLLTDRFSFDEPEESITLRVTPGGRTTTGSALARLIYSLPSALAVLLLTVAVFVTWIISAVMILVEENYPDRFYGFHKAVVRWGARLLAYHASLTDEYPPFRLDTGSETVAS